MIKLRLKFEGCKFCLEANQVENKIIFFKTSNTDTDSLRENQEEFLKIID